ncbi:MAG: hypothetical protein WCQ16_06245 [Verrucomicrobiae bacterium]
MRDKTTNKERGKFMAFAPVLNDIGPALTAQGFGNASQSTLQGAQALAGGISSAGKSVGSGIGSALEAMKEKAALQSANAARAQAWADSGFLDTNPKVASIFERAAAEKDPYRQRGILTVGDALVRMESETQRVQNLMKQSRQLAQEKATISANAPGKVLKSADGFFQQINGQWERVLDPQGNPVQPPARGSSGQNLGDALNGLSAQADQQEISRIKGEIAVGNQKPGPDFLPDGLWFGEKPFKQQLVEKQAAMTAGGGSPVGAPQGAAVQAWQSPDQVAAAVQGGQLTREAARQILQSQFGFR